MTIAKDLMQTIRIEASLLVQDRTGNNQSEQDVIAQAVKRVTDKVPSIIAHTIADGGSYAEVMPLLEQRDYSCNTWKDRLFGKAPLKSSLKGPAAAVFAWCEESGLQPFLAPYRGAKRSESRIIIQWQPAHMQANLSGCPDFIARLQAVTSEALAQQAAQTVRTRAKTVREGIVEIHRKIATATKAGLSEAVVFDFHSCNGSLDLRGNNFASDLFKYCEGLGLTVTTKTWDASGSGPRGGLYRYQFTASWKAGTTPGK